MEKENKKIVYEAVLIHNAFYKEIEIFPDSEYSRYHQNNADWFRSFSNRINQILGFTGKTIEEAIAYYSTIHLTQAHKKALSTLRKEPMFKKLMGEIALQQIDELEDLLGNQITSQGKSWIVNGKGKTAVKTEQQLDKELNTYSDKLSQLLASKSITSEQYDNYIQNLNYIYDYYISRSKGEQIPFRKMSNKQYEIIEQTAQENGISFHEQMSQINQDLIDSFEEVQDLEAHYGKAM